MSIKVPGTTVSSSINQGHYSVGARYRFVTGTSSFAFGASYWRRFYIADRHALMSPTLLDMPDVSYTAITPIAIARIAASPTIGAFFTADFPLMLSTGQIQSGTSYGRGKVIAFDITGGADVALAPHYALHLAAEISQAGFTFNAVMRGVSSATDRLIGLTATIAVDY